MHPVEHDFGRSIPASRHVPCHLIVRLSGQSKVKDLLDKTHRLSGVMAALGEGNGYVHLLGWGMGGGVGG